MTERPETTDLVSVGQTWREPAQGDRWAREIIAMDFGRLPGTYPSVEWRRPGSMKSRWCGTRRFLKWIADTKAYLK